MDTKTSQSTKVVVYLLYTVSILGLLSIFSSAQDISSLPFPDYYLDLSMYGVLAILAYFIYRKSKVAIILYAIVAIIWFAALIGYLPWKFSYGISIMMVLTQLCLVVAAYAILWFKH